MIVHEEQAIGVHGVSLEIVWRNPHSKARVHLRVREKANPYCRWTEQASKFRARRSNWTPVSPGLMSFENNVATLINREEERAGVSPVSTPRYVRVSGGCYCNPHILSH